MSQAAQLQLTKMGRVYVSRESVRQSGECTSVGRVYVSRESVRQLGECSQSGECMRASRELSKIRTVYGRR